MYSKIKDVENWFYVKTLKNVSANVENSKKILLVTLDKYLECSGNDVFWYGEGDVDN